MYENRYKKILYVIITAALIFIDQFSKYIIRTNSGFYICNKGIAFGIQLPELAISVIIICLLLIIAVKIFNFQFFPPNRDPAKAVVIFNQFSISKFQISSLWAIFVLSGAVSNIIDRLTHGCIIDFIDLKFWPLFNLADVMIVTGAILLIIQNFRVKVKN